MNDTKKDLDKVEHWFDQLVDLNPSEQVEQLSSIKAQQSLNDAELILLQELLESDKHTAIPEHIDPSVAFPDGSEHSLFGLHKDYQVGSYRIIRPLGHGGMGTVYLAERNDGIFEQHVAIKVSKHGIDKKTQERFNNERKILAKLTHPHIAHLIDGGMTAENQAFLIMEYVDGLSITDFCKKHKTSLNQRIKLIQQVAQAVSFAHRQLILHRDLKPDNIWVDQQGQIKLLDFGIAKLIDENDAPRTATQVMTRNYASPEQIQAKPATIQSDLFSLAVVAYELITGHHPFPSRNFLEREQNVISGNHLKITQRNTQGEVAHPELSDIPDSAIQGDLENILLKALAPEPENRYETVDAFAQDLQNYLSKRPVSARKPSTTYTIYKWIQRHKTISALTFITISTLIGATIFSFNKAQVAIEQQKIAESQKQLAELETEKSQQVADFLKTLFRKAKPENSTKQLTAQDLLIQGFEDIENEEFISQETKFELLHLIHDSMKSMGKYQESLSTIQTHYDQCVISLGKDHKSCQRFLNIKSRIEFELNLHEEAIKTLDIAQEIAKNRIPFDRNELFDFYAIRFGVLFKMGKVDEGLALQIEMLEIEQKAPDPTHYRILQLSGNIAVALIRKDKFDEARFYLDQMPQYYKLFDENELPLWLGAYYAVEAYFYSSMREAKKSFEFRKKDAELFLNNYETLPDLYAEKLYNAGVMATRSGFVEEGLQYFIESYNFYKDKISGSETNQLNIKVRIILHYLMSNNLELAQKEFQNIDPLSETITNQSKINQLYQIARSYISTLKKVSTKESINESCPQSIEANNMLNHYCQTIRTIDAINRMEYAEALSQVEEMLLDLKNYPNDYLNFKDKALELKSLVIHK